MKKLAYLLILAILPLASCSKANGQGANQANADSAQVAQEDTITLLFAGDAMQHITQLDAAHKNSGYDYSQCFTKVEGDIQAADYAVINLECSLGGAPYKGYPRFSAPDAWPTQLKKVGFDMLLTANNHCLDRNDDGAIRTIRVLDSLKVDHIGTYVNAADRAKRLPFVANVKGVKIAMLDYTYSTNGIKVKGNVVVDYIDKEVIAADIAKAKKTGADMICVNMHWGKEYTLTPVKEQKDLAQFLVDQGVDLIIGGHPHVVEPFEVRHNAKLNKDVLVIYSLGNYISGMKQPDTIGGAMVRVKLYRKNGKVTLGDCAYKLVFCQKALGNENYMLVPEERASEIRSDCKPIANQFFTRTHNLVMKNNIKVDQYK